MSIPAVPSQTPGQSTITMAHATSAYSALWWTTSTISDIPADSVGWLTAQGWEILNVTYDDTTTPPTPYYSLGRQSLQNWMILQSLLNAYTVAYNEARDCNSIRYNEVVTNWTAMLASSETHLQDQVTEQNSKVVLYLANLATYMDEVDTLINANQSKIVSDVESVDATLAIMNAKLSDLEANYAANATTIGGLLTTQQSYLETFVAAFDVKLTSLGTNYTTNAATIGSLLTAQSGYLTSFLSDVTAKLDDLDANYAAHLSEIEDVLSEADTDLSAFSAAQSAAISDIQSAYDDLVQTIDALLTTADSDLTGIESEIDAILTSLETDYSAVAASINGFLTLANSSLGEHKTDYAAFLELLVSDYTAHALVAGSLLDNLGAAELARINEEFAAALAVQVQQLVDRGLYQSDVLVAVTARNARDRDEQVQKLNDRLAREQLDNQHKLYEQQSSMRSRVLDGKAHVYAVDLALLQYRAAQTAGLYGLLQDSRGRTLAAQQSLYGLKQAHSRLKIDARTAVYNAGQEVRRQVVTSADRVVQLKMALAQWTSGQRDKLLEQVQSVVAQQIATLGVEHGAEQDVSRVAVTERNRLYEQNQAVVVQQMGGLEREHAAEQDVSRSIVGERDRMLGQLQDAVRGVLAGQERYAVLTLQNATTLAEHKHRIIVEKMNEHAMRLTGLKETHADNMKLMAYQLDTRNQLLVGLYGFVERRTDEGPSIKDLAQLCTGLGDAGGGWLSP